MDRLEGIHGGQTSRYVISLDTRTKWFMNEILTGRITDKGLDGDLENVLWDSEDPKTKSLYLGRQLQKPLVLIGELMKYVNYSINVGDEGPIELRASNVIAEYFPDVFEVMIQFKESYNRAVRRNK